MAINLVLLDGLVKSPSLRYDDSGKPELRWTLTQTDKSNESARPWVSYWPCCAIGAAAERLAGEIEEGEHIIITSAKLAYRKRASKSGEQQSRLEILVWSIDHLPGEPSPHESTEGSDQGG
jgi:hypothetical protein